MATLNQDQRGAGSFRGVAAVSTLMFGVLVTGIAVNGHPPDLYPSHYEDRELHEEMWLDVPDWDQGGGSLQADRRPASHAERGPVGLWRPGPRLLAAAGRSRHPGEARSDRPSTRRFRDDHLPQPEPASTGLSLGADRPEPLQAGLARTPLHHRAEPPARPVHPVDASATRAARLRRGRGDHAGRGRGRRRPPARDQRHDDANRPARADAVGGHHRLRHRLERRDRPQHHDAGAIGLRDPRRRDADLRDRPVVPADGAVHRQRRVAEQAVPGGERVRPRVRRLRPCDHRARDLRGLRER